MGVLYMLKDLIEQGFGEKEDLNCAEKILWGANTAYNLGLNRNDLKLASGFGGGMGIEDKCGALTASIMVLGRLFVKERAHESTKIKELTKELFEEYKKEMGSIDCAPLKEKYKTEELKCRNIIAKAAEILDRIVERELADSE
jgi:C_GCAxxG_C_C family probable redox protein